MMVTGFDRLQLPGRKAHAWVRPKAYRVIRRIRCAPQWRMIRQGLFQQLAEAIQVGLGHPPLQYFQ
ncbi:hypothetical protein D3C87_1978150 [compost metagenome]